ncbi:MAG: racemase [Deltaproteobacteria bacterium]|nr:MAG: racemase [Deltaproteobacteria bacterium]
MADEKIRIWHQSFTVLENLADYQAALRGHLNHVSRPTTDVILHGMHPETYATEYPGIDIRYCYFQFLHANQFVLNGLKAQREGYDAYLICTLPDPALWETRSVLNIPVLGYGETAMALSSLLGRRFGILVFIEELIPLLEQNVSRYGFSPKKAAIRHVGFSFSDIDFKAPSANLEQFQEAALKMIRQDGAEVIIPGEAVMCVLLASQNVNRIENVPVLDALAGIVKLAEAMIDLKRLCGIEPCGSGYFNAMPPEERTAELLRFYGLDSFK